MDKKYYEGLLETEKRGRSSVLSGNIVAGVGDASIEPATQLPLMDGEEADVGRSNRYAREDHVHPRDDTKVDKVEGYGLSQISSVEKVDGLYQMVLSDGEKIYVPTTDISLKDMVICETRGDLATKEITLPYRLYEGMHIIIKFTKTNIISPEDLRLKVNGLPEKTIRYRNGWLPSADTLSNGRIYDFVYYNDGFELVGDLDVKGGEGNPSPATAAPAMDGTAAVGSSVKYAREDHVHPHDSSKVDKVSGKGLSTNDYTAAEKEKLAGVSYGAEANQNAFSSVKVGNTTLTATAKTDTLELVAGSNVTITPDEQNKTVTIEAAAGSAGNIGEGTGYKSVILNDTQYSYADGDYSRAQGQYTHAYGNYSNAEGYGSTAGRQDDKGSYIAGHAEGNYTEATGQAAHSEGSFTHATASGSHSEGHTTTASGENSHSEGMSTTASGGAAHSEGANTVAAGYQAHAEGFQTIANGNTSHSEGDNTAAYGKSTHVFGAYNEYDDQVQPYDRGPYVEIVGNGNYETRSNARTLDWNGNEWVAGEIRVGGNDYASGSKLATESYVDDKDFEFTVIYNKDDPTSSTYSKTAQEVLDAVNAGKNVKAFFKNLTYTFICLPTRIVKNNSGEVTDVLFECIDTTVSGDVISRIDVYQVDVYIFMGESQFTSQNVYRNFN